MKYTTLGIVMHAECNAECDICSESCSPNRHERLDAERIKEIIDSFGDTSINTVAFTGGEPFLYYDRLIDLVRYAKQKGFSPTVVTNGFWAISDEIVEERIRELVDSGLTKLNISYDNYHKKYIAQENINRIVKQCNRYHLPYLIAVVKLKMERIGDLVDAFPVENGLINLMIVPCEPAGRAKIKFEERSFVRNTPINGQSCPYNGIITIASDGRIYPCCAHQVFGSALSIGHYSNLDADQIFYRLKNNGLLYILRNYGLDPLLEMNPSVKQELPEYVSSPCEICEKLFSNGISQYKEQVENFISQHVIQNDAVKKV